MLILSYFLIFLHSTCQLVTMYLEKRRLAAIVFSDIHKFTEKMGRDENTMMQLLYRHNRIFEYFSRHYDGRIVKSTGDGFLLEFGAASNAVLCCIAVQGALRHFNLGREAAEALQVRMGVHLGEVIEHGADIFGAGVNIAARLEPQAEPGAICLSVDVVKSVQSVLKLPFEALGPITLKHVETPLEVFRLRISEDILNAVQTDFSLEDIVDKIARSREKEYLKSIDASAKLNNTAAVLPFKALSARPEYAHIGEGFAEALIFGLTKEKLLNVIPLASVMEIGEARHDAAAAAALLGAAYVIRGVVQQSGRQLKFLIDLHRAADNRSLINEEWDGTDDDIFDIQSKVIKSVLFVLMSAISDETQAALSAAAPKNPLAGSYYLKGSYQDRKAITWEDKKKALALLERAVQTDKQFALAHCSLAKAYAEVHGRWQNDRAWLDKALKEAELALGIEPELPEALEALGFVNWRLGDLEAAELNISQAINLRPLAVRPRLDLAEVHIQQGRLEEAGAVLEEADVLTRDCGNLFSRADVMIRLARLNSIKGLYLNALEMLNDSKRIAQDNHNTYLEAGIRLIMGNTFGNMGKNELAFKNYEQSYTLFKELKEEKYLAGSLNNLGLAYQNLGQFAKAMSLFQEANAMAVKIGDVRTQASASTNLGRILGNLGRNEEAVRVLQEAVALRRMAQERLAETRALIDLAAVYCDMGRHSEALETYSEAQMLLTDAGDLPMLAAVLLNIGEIYELQNLNDRALDYYDDAESVFNRMDVSQYKPYLYLFRSRVFFNTGRYTEAGQELQRLLNDKDTKPTIRHRAELYLACCNGARGEPVEQWLPAAKEAVEALARLGSQPELIEGLRALGEFLLKFSQTDESRALLTRGLAAAQTSRMNWEADKIKAVLEKLDDPLNPKLSA